MCLNDGSMPRQAPPAQQAWFNGGGAEAPQSAYGHASYGAPSQPPAAAPSYEQRPWGASSNAGPASYDQQRPAPYSDRPSGRSWQSPASAPPAPAPYRDNPQPYGGSYGGPAPPQNEYGQNQYDQNQYDKNQYGQNQSSYGQSQYDQYQKKEASTSQPRYNASSLMRDNRPTVLVGQSMSFAQPPVGGFSGNVAGYGGASSAGDFGSASSSAAPRMPPYVENMNKMMNAHAGITMSGGMTVVGDTSSTKLGKTVEGLKKMSLDAR